MHTWNAELRWTLRCKLSDPLLLIVLSDSLFDSFAISIRFEETLEFDIVSSPKKEFIFWDKTPYKLWWNYIRLVSWYRWRFHRFCDLCVIKVLGCRNLSECEIIIIMVYYFMSDPCMACNTEWIVENWFTSANQIESVFRSIGQHWLLVIIVKTVSGLPIPEHD